MARGVMLAVFRMKRRRSWEDDRVVVITLTGKGRALQEQAKDVPRRVGGCIGLPPGKAKALYDILYELLGQQNEDEAKGA